MKIGLFDPYLDTLGGGERYILSIAECLQDKNEVTLFWDDKEILRKTKERFLIDLKNINLVENIFTKDVDSLTRIKKTLDLDYLVYISDGSIPFVLAKNVIAILQYPISGIRPKNIGSRLKLLNTRVILCYSTFVKDHLFGKYPVPIKVVYPPVVQISGIKKKEKVILSVGRFTQGKNAKKQEFMLDFFKKHKLHFKGWRLILAGAALSEDAGFVKGLKEKIDKTPIEIYENLNFAQLSRLFCKASIYWHAAGFDEDVDRNPEFAEHFGISVVEAMSAGCVPIVFNGGGLKEIVQNDRNGFTWISEKELFDRTKLLMQDSWKMEEMSKSAMMRSEDFSIDVFCQKIHEIIN